LSFQQINYQPEVVRFLQRGLQMKQIAHAYCFYGPSGTGKRKVALELAKALNCERSRVDPCDECPTCRQIEHGNHPDIVVLRPDGAFIKIDQVRALQDQFQYSAAAGVTRVVIMEQAEKMRVEAANSLLKFLEEPLSPMVAILITEKVQAILPTIISRCQKIHFKEVSPKVRMEILEKEGIPDYLAIIFSQIHLDNINFLSYSLQELEDLCLRMMKWCKQILEDGSIALLTIQEDWFKQAINQELVPLILELLLLWLRELLHYQLTQQSTLFIKWLEECREQACKWERKRLLQAIEIVLQARGELSKFVQPQAVLERIVLEIQSSREVRNRRGKFTRIN
jgi:DNA polymerase-3 subunit delta'